MTSKAELSEAILALRAEIDTLEDSDADTRKHLAQLADKMEVQLQGTPTDEENSLTDAVMDVIELYEARYPRITAMANDLMTRLAAMGI